MIVYIGAAIDTALGAPAEQFSELGRLVIKAAGDSSIILFNPLTAFINAHAITAESDMEFLIQTNNRALDSADLAVFSWTASPSMGVPLEIQRRKESDKPMVIWNRTPKKLGIYLRHGLGANQIIVDSEEDLIASLTEWIQSGSGELKVPEKEIPAPSLPAPTIGFIKPPGNYYNPGVKT